MKNDPILRAYIRHARRARQRGIRMDFTFEEWVAWWISQLGPDWFSKRGRKSDQYQMCRKGDAGPYAPWNVFCGTAFDNSSYANTGTKNPAARLTADQVVLIYKSRASYSHLAAVYGVTKGAIAAIKQRRKWQSVTADLADLPSYNPTSCLSSVNID